MNLDDYKLAAPEISYYCMHCDKRLAEHAVHEINNGRYWIDLCERCFLKEKERMEWYGVS